MAHDSDNALQRLLALADEQAERGDPWLRDALEDYLSGTSLEHALQLSGGARSARHYYWRQRRDQALWHAWCCVEATSDWRRAVLLAQRVRRFQAVTWPRVRHHERAPAALDPVGQALFAAAQAAERIGADLPATPEGLLGAVRRCTNGAGSVPLGGAMQSCDSSPQKRRDGRT